MQVSIIIVNYNTLQLTQQCIESVFTHTQGVSFEVIVVDNASTDGSKDVLAQDKRIKYFYNTENVGFGKANNIGFSQAQGEYVFLLNSDTELLNDAVTAFYTFAKQAPSNVGCIGALLKDQQLQTTHSYGRFPTYRNSLEEWIVYPILSSLKIPFKGSKFDYPLNSSLSNGCEVEYVIGADLFLRRETASKYGLFDPDYFMYYEETDMQYRYRQHGLVSMLTDTPGILHYEGGSLNAGKRLIKKRWPLQSLFLFFRKHRSKASYYPFVAIFLLLFLPLLVISPYSWQDKKAMFRAMSSKGFF